MDFGKLFDYWNTRKKETHASLSFPEFSDGDIWWVQFGQNISTELFGKGDDFLRPAIIVRKVFNNACIVVPLSSKKKTGNYYYSFPDKDGQDQYAVLHQIRYIDAKRLKYRFGKMKKQAFEEMKAKLVSLIV